MFQFEIWHLFATRLAQEGNVFLSFKCLSPPRGAQAACQTIDQFTHTQKVEEKKDFPILSLLPHKRQMLSYKPSKERASEATARSKGVGNMTALFGVVDF